MFTRSILGSQFQPQSFGASPFASVGGITPFPPQMVGYNPFLSTLPPQVSALGAYSGYSPIPPQIGSYGYNPYQINPLVAAQLAAVNPGILPGIVPHIWGGPVAQQSVPGLFNPLAQQWGGDPSLFGQSPFGQSPFGQSLIGGLHPQVPYQGQISPYMVQDPITTALLTQQLNPLAQQRLPIRPLTGGQQVDPYQVGLSGITGLPISQMVDPYSALAQAQLMSQYAINPMQQMARPYPFTNWPGSPHTIGQ